MRKSVLSAVAAMSAMTFAVAACGSSSKSSSNAGGTTTAAAGATTTAAAGGPSPARSASSCPTPSPPPAGRPRTARSSRQAFEAAGVKSDIQNAQGDKTQFQTIADQMITEGVNVLIIVEPRRR